MDALNIAILGPGAVGGFMAAMLWKAGHTVTCVARESTARRIADHGIDLCSVQFGDFTARPAAMAQLTTPQDLLIIATKATTLESALKRIAPASVVDSAIMPLLNGTEHVDILRRKFGPQLIPATISLESKYDGPARIRHTTDFSFIRYASCDLNTDQLDRLDKALATSGVRMIRADSEMDVIWGKLVRLNALACTTAASGMTLGPIREHPTWSKHLAAIVHEGVAVARAEGYDLSAQTVLDQLTKLPETLGSSMQRDIEAERPSELDAIAGGVLRTGQKHGLACPVIENMIHRIQARIKDIADNQK